jgi:ABC-type antimicrobial peptide transport system permease subunit
MSETFFPISDLLRRRLQSSLFVLALASSVGGTLFLLLFSARIGFQVLSLAEGRLTSSFSTVISRFILFEVFLVFVVGAVIVSFMVFVMMTQRIRDIGLMKAAGCPNRLVFGYFFTELLIVTSLGCVLGVAGGVAADIISSVVFSAVGFKVSDQPPNIWIMLVVFALFFVVAFIFGVKPILDTTKVEPSRALSPAHYAGVVREEKFKPISRRAFALRMAFRSLLRRRVASSRIALCLAATFLLSAVAVTGGIIANQTTQDWVEKPTGRGLIVIGHKDVLAGYQVLLSKFHQPAQDLALNYTKQEYMMPPEISAELDEYSHSGNMTYETRLLLTGQVHELMGFKIDPETASTTPVGDNRVADTVIVGVNPQKLLVSWSMEGRNLSASQAGDALVGDTLAQALFSDPLFQNMTVSDRIFHVVGVCLDPLNNGNVTYVPLLALQVSMNLDGVNMVFVRLSGTLDRVHLVSQLQTFVESVNPDFQVFDLDEALRQNLGFLGYIWSSIVLLPLFSLGAASLSLIGYVIIVLDEQRQEFGILRAIGTHRSTVFGIVSWQSILVSLGGYGVGVALGMMLTLLILIPEPVVTVFTVLEVAGWLSIAPIATVSASLVPAAMFARRPLAKLIAQP